MGLVRPVTLFQEGKGLHLKFSGFDHLFTSMKSENFTPASTSLAEDFTISWDDTAHGVGGPVQSSYPVFQFQSISE